MNLAIYFALAYLTISLGEAFAPPLTMSSRADKIWEVEVRLGEETRMIAVRPGDSILTACELSQLRHPYDCRRGNCISCAGRFTPSSSRNLETYIVGPEGGKDPETFLCDEAKDEGFFLACCSYPVGPGLVLELGTSGEAWKVCG
ncbi:unnamed protein product [Chrysoparadoxa australica]